MLIKIGLLAVLLQTVTSLNILLFLIGTNQFERGTFEYLAQQLALRHHDVITVKPILIPEEPRLVKPKLHLVREKTLKNLLPKKQYEPLEKIGNEVPWSSTYEVERYDCPYWEAHNASCYKMLNSNLMDQLKKDELDLVITYSGNPCQLAIAHVLGKPVIYFDQEGLTDETLVAAGVPPSFDFPSSHCPLPQTSFQSVNRFINGLCYLREYLAQSRVPFLASLVSKRYKNLDLQITKMFAEDYELKKRFKSFPDVNEAKARSSLFFVNTDRLIEYDRPLPAHVIPIGGMHIDHAKPLFASIGNWRFVELIEKTFEGDNECLIAELQKDMPWNTSIESAEKGMIVVTMGTQANSAHMPQYMVKALFGALSKLTKYRIYWRVGPTIKLDGINVEKPPAHINFTAYIPQNDLLAHSSCKLLITNGGMLSVMEAVAHGVPMIGVPLYGVNRNNLQKVVNKGLGLIVEKSEISESALSQAINNVLQAPKFKNKAKEMSKEFKSRKSSPFQEALHWIEFIANNQGNPLRSPAVHPMIQLMKFLCLDVIALLLLVLYLPFAFTMWLLKRSLRRQASSALSKTQQKTETPKRDSNNNGDQKKTEKTKSQ